MRDPAPVRALAGSLLLLAAAVPAAAQEPSVPRLASLTLENDFFAGYDRHYTNGVQAAFLFDRARLPSGLRLASPWSRGADPTMVLAVGQRIYTPADKGRADPDPADRPYAGWLYAMTDARRVSGGVVDHFTASVGVVGPAALGRQTQRLAHRVLRASESRGWHRQLRNEPALMVGAERAWRGLGTWRLGGSQADLSARVGGALGNVFTYASAGLVARFGSNLPEDLPVTHISLGPPRDGYRGTASFGWYVWAGVDARAVARNIFLDGNSFRDGPGVDRKPFGHDVQLGAALAWPTARVGFTLVERSREFEGQGGPDRFGQLALSFAY